MDKKKFLSILALGSILVILYTFLSHVDIAVSSIGGFLASTFSTLFFGIVLAFILDIPVSFFENRLRRTGKRLLVRSARPLSILVSLVIFFLLVAVVLGFIIPSTIDAISMISQSIVLLSDRLQGDFTNEEPGFDAALHSLLNWLDMSLDELGERIRDFARDNSPRFITSTFNTILGTISSFVTFFVALVFAIYFVSSKGMLSRHALYVLELIDRPSISAYACHLAQISYRAFRHFVIAQALEAVIIGALCTLGMFLLRLPNAAMIGVLTGVTALVPVYGAFIGVRRIHNHTPAARGESHLSKGRWRLPRSAICLHLRSRHCVRRGLRSCRNAVRRPRWFDLLHAPEGETCAHDGGEDQGMER